MWRRYQKGKRHGSAQYSIHFPLKVAIKRKLLKNWSKVSNKIMKLANSSEVKISWLKLIVKKELEVNSILNQPFKLTNGAENCDVTNI